MKVKLSWIPFIPIAIAMAALKITGVFASDSNGDLLGMNFIEVSYTVFGMSLALFVVCVLLNIIDRKTAPVYSAGRNIPAAIFSVLSAAFVLASSVLSLVDSTENAEYFLMYIICAFFALFASIAFIIMARVHFTGISPISNVSFLYIFPSLWGCSELVACFLDATKVSVSATDMTSLFSFIFLSLYLFSHSMVVAKIRGRNPVKASFIYGLPAAALSLTAGVYYTVTGITDGLSGSVVVKGLMFFSLSFYVISFVAELTKGIMTKDEVEIIDEIPTEGDNKKEEEDYVETENYDELVFSQNYDKSADYSSKPTKDINDFIIGYAREDDNTPPVLTDEEKNRGDDITEGFYFGGNMPEAPEKPIIQEETSVSEEPSVLETPSEQKKPEIKNQTTEKTEAPSKPLSESKSVNDRMSEIDRLIAELESKK